MPDAVIHPTPQELTAFGLGKLPERAAAVVAAHLESCLACRQVVAGVSADSFLNKVRDAKQDKTSLPPSLAQQQNAPSSADRPAMPIVPCPDLPPELMGHPKYLILRELGRGGMGVVYQARQTVMKRQVVIKVVNRSLLDRPGALERFRQEVEAAAQLSHRNIVTAYDAEQVGELHILVMEFVPGRSLAELIEKNGPLPVRHACYYMHQAASGLQHAHKRGMVHRDIKPQNLMVTPKGQIKILDFGLAKMASERETDKGLTPSDACMGTAEYMAPEQALDARKADIRADLYSLGCTLYCLLAGRPPFHEDTWVKTIFAHRDKMPQPLTELRSDIPERLWRVVARLMAKDPAKRYAKPIEVAQALVPFIKSGARGERTLPQRAGSLAKGTVFEQETSEVKEIPRHKPVKLPPRDVPLSKEPAPPSAELTDALSVLKEDGLARVEEGPVLPAWWKRPGVLAGAFGVSLALILMAVIISAAKMQKQNEDTNKSMASNKLPHARGEVGPRNNGEDFEVLPPQLKTEPRKPEQQEEQSTKRSDTERSNTIEKQEEQPVDPRPAVPRVPAADPAATTVIENKEPRAKPVPPQVKKPTTVDVAINKGVSALRRLQRADGTWPHQFIGATALAGLTLLECGADKEDQAVLRAAQAVRNASIDLAHTYSISLSLLFLDRLGDREDEPIIESLAARLLAGQDAASGGWSYWCPPISATDKQRLQENLNKRKKSWPGPQPVFPVQDMSSTVGRLPPDNSNTQFAALGLWAGHRHGAKIDHAVARLDLRFRNTQQPDGGWGYEYTPTAGSSATMTCAGLFALAIADGATLENVRKRKPKAKLPDIGRDKHLIKGLEALGVVIDNPKDVKPQQPGAQLPPGQRVGGRTYYFLWALERVAVALDLKTIGKKDWYGWGAEILLASQKEDGSWSGEYAQGGIDTCFALLFLKRANLTPDLTVLLRAR